MGSDAFRSDLHREGKILFPIAAKLVLIISVLVLLSLGTITALVTFYVSEDVRITAEENNRTVKAVRRPRRSPSFLPSAPTYSCFSTW